LNNKSLNFHKRDVPISVDNFLIYLRTIRGKSTNTIQAYQKDLKVFFKFMMVWKGEVNEDIDFDDVNIKNIQIEFISQITLQDIHRFLYYVEENRNNGSHARSRKVATLRSFFNYLFNIENCIPINPTLKLESPGRVKRHPVYLSLDESRTLLNSLNKDRKNYARDYCILTLFLNCGMRLSELCKIRISKIKGDTLVILGKGNKERTVYLNQACLYSINRYLEMRSDAKVLKEYKDYLFLSTHNRPIDQRTVEKMVKNKIIKANIINGEKYTPHKLRHTAATLLYKSNVDIRKIQTILGHSSISTTEIYTHLEDDAIREAVNLNPIGLIDYETGNTL
jgi:site-specific recombinase XerD